ncbi:hypothetical protein GDO81_007637 [Engystomops pustulosus]|uniref:Uncharacterized protein n=1 Tax=Engystomops pustulosus TaxID=76066 RepID=A0AAV7C8R0_ENGPU|nr:hypothetical protein GDO81_007637 [Engystomops pustulosus]
MVDLSPLAVITVYKHVLAVYSVSALYIDRINPIPGSSALVMVIETSYCHCHLIAGLSPPVGSRLDLFGWTCWSIAVRKLPACLLIKTHVSGKVLSKYKWHHLQVDSAISLQTAKQKKK